MKGRTAGGHGARRLGPVAVVLGSMLALAGAAAGERSAPASSEAQSADARLASTIRGFRAGEIAYFAMLRGRATPQRARVLAGLGARPLHRYHTIDAFALASTRAVRQGVAQLPWVTRLAPVELVVERSHDALATDQTRGTAADVGAVAAWAQGITGAGVRIAVLDTGADATHPDLNDQDFRHWTLDPLNPVRPPKIVASRNFVNAGVDGCEVITGSFDGHGHGTHVSGIAAGSGEGGPLVSDNGLRSGVAPQAELAVGKVLTDAGAGNNADLLKALEESARPVGSSACAMGADIVNLSLGSEARPTRLNSSQDIDLVSLMLNRLAVSYGTLFVAAAGNSGPYIGSALESPGSASQALSVAAAAKDWDVNHDDTDSGDSCAGWRHPPTPPEDNTCANGPGDQPPSISSFSSRGPSGDVWLRPDLAGPGYNVVSAQASTGAALAANDLNLGTRGDPWYATATGTSMATPAVAGSAALVLNAYRAAYGANPSGTSGVTGLPARSFALVRAALMNTAGHDLFESRWILTGDALTQLSCPTLGDPLLPIFCSFAEIFVGALTGSSTVYEVRNRAADPYVGPFAEGAGKINASRAIAALRDGVVMYSRATGSGPDAGTGPRDFQGSWQVGAVGAGTTTETRFILHAAPGKGPFTVTFSFEGGRPSDGSTAIPAGSGGWSVRLPGRTTVKVNRDETVDFKLSVPNKAAAGHYTGRVVASVSNGQVLRIPVFASIALHDTNLAAGNVPGPQARLGSAADVFAKGDTAWPSVLGQSLTGSQADWLVHPVQLASGLASAKFSVYDSAAGDETYDLYVYNAALNLIGTTHPWDATLGVGNTDLAANAARGASTQAAPQTLTLATPAPGRYYVAVSRAKIGGTCPCTGDFGAFVLMLDERG